MPQRLSKLNGPIKNQVDSRFKYLMPSVNSIAACQIHPSIMAGICLKLSGLERVASE
jgi:hypothetical protein